MKEWSPEIAILAERIVGLTLLQAVELKDYLKEVHGVEVSSGSILPPLPDQPQEKPPEQTEFDLVLEGLADPSKKIIVIKTVREITGLPLKEGKEVVESAPKVLKQSLPKAEAEKLKSQLEESGAKVSLR